MAWIDVIVLLVLSIWIALLNYFLLKPTDSHTPPLLAWLVPQVPCQQNPTYSY